MVCRILPCFNIVLQFVFENCHCRISRRLESILCISKLNDVDKVIIMKTRCTDCNNSMANLDGVLLTVLFKSPRKIKNPKVEYRDSWKGLQR